jgi:ribonucleotide reductase alpha subunit
VHPHYSILAARVSVDNLRKQTSTSIRDVAHTLYNCTDKCGRKAALLEDKIYQIIQEHHQTLDAAIDFTRDFNYDFFGFKTLERSYLLKVDGKIVERPQHMLMRVSIGIHREDIPAAI